MDLNQKPNLTEDLETMTESLCLLRTHWDPCPQLSTVSQSFAECNTLFQHCNIQQYGSTMQQHQTNALPTRRTPGKLPRQLRPSRKDSKKSKRQAEPLKSRSMSRGSPGLEILRSQLEHGLFFQLDQDEMYRCISRAFHKEIRYLKHAYATFYPAGLEPSSDAPSRILFAEGFPEIDRTLNGILALRWIVLNDYESFTNNQRFHKLTEESFFELRQFFQDSLDDFQDHEAMYALIVMQMTNDLGKSTKLVEDLTAIDEDDISADMNHDAVMDRVIDRAEDLIPSLISLQPDWNKMVKKLIKLSAQYNPAQLIQGECQSIALEALIKKKYDEFELDMKFMELFLDLSGAAGHVNHEGAKAMTEPTYRGMMRAREISIEVASGGMSTEDAYDSILQFRIDLLGPVSNRIRIDDLSNNEDYTITRLLSMGRVVGPEDATLYADVFRNLEEEVQVQLIENLVLSQATVVLAHTDEEVDMLYGIQPTYFPSLLALVTGEYEEKFAMLTALFTFLAEALQVELYQVLTSSEDLDGMEVEDILIAERDVRHLAEKVKRGDTSFVYNNQDMPRVQIAKTRSEI